MRFEARVQFGWLAASIDEESRPQPTRLRSTHNGSWRARVRVLCYALRLRAGDVTLDPKSAKSRSLSKSGRLADRVGGFGHRCTKSAI